MKITILLLLFSLMNLPQGFNDRRIIVITANELTPEVKDQIDRFQKNSMQLEKRRLAVFTLIEGEVTSILNSTEKSKAFVEKNTSEYTSTSSLKMYLIGLDQGVKQTFTTLTQPQQFFDTVDSMPMRKAEMRNN